MRLFLIIAVVALIGVSIYAVMQHNLVKKADTLAGTAGGTITPDWKTKKS